MFTPILLKWLMSVIAVLLTAYVLAGVAVESVYTALVLAVIFGFLNAVARPFLIVLTLPVNILTLGLFILVINGFLFWVPSTFVRGFYVENFLWAIAGALLVSIFSWFGNKLIQERYSGGSRREDVLRRNNTHE